MTNLIKTINRPRCEDIKPLTEEEKNKQLENELKWGKLDTYEIVDGKIIIKTLSGKYTVDYNETTENELLEIIQTKYEEANKEYENVLEERSTFRCGLAVGLLYAAMTIVISLGTLSLIPLLFAMPCIVLVKVIQELQVIKEKCLDKERIKNHWSIILENRQKDKERRKQLDIKKLEQVNTTAVNVAKKLLETPTAEKTEVQDKRINLKK